MAEFGIQVFNNNNRLQVDSRYRNFSLKAKGSAASNVGWPSGSAGVTYTWQQCTLSFACTEHALLALRGSSAAGPGFSGLVTVLDTSYSGGIKTFRILTVTRAPFSYWLYDLNMPIPTTGWGVAVWNAAGQPVFSSDSKLMRVVATWTGQPPIFSPWGPPAVSATVRNIDVGGVGTVDLAVVSGQQALYRYVDTEEMQTTIDGSMVDTSINRVVLAAATGSLPFMTSWGGYTAYKPDSNFLILNVNNQ